MWNVARFLFFAVLIKKILIHFWYFRLMKLLIFLDPLVAYVTMQECIIWRKEIFFLAIYDSSMTTYRQSDMNFFQLVAFKNWNYFSKQRAQVYMISVILRTWAHRSLTLQPFCFHHNYWLCQAICWLTSKDWLKR